MYVLAIFFYTLAWLTGEFLEMIVILIKIYVNRTYMWFNVSQFDWNVKYVNDIYPYFVMILNEKLANFCVMSHEMTKIAEIGWEQDFSI